MRKNIFNDLFFWIIVILCLCIAILLNFYLPKIIIRILGGAAIGYVCMSIGLFLYTL
jgi:hypothetical protein